MRISLILLRAVHVLVTARNPLKSSCLIGHMFVDMSGMKSLKETTVLISLRTSSLLTGCGSSIMALTLAGSGLMMVSKWTTRQFELKLGLFGIELHILFSCPWHHISQQATMLLLKRQ